MIKSYIHTDSKLAHQAHSIQQEFKQFLNMNLPSYRQRQANDIPRIRSQTNIKEMSISMAQCSTPLDSSAFSASKRQCDSHFFQLKPIPGCKTHFGPTLYKWTHHGDQRPYPIFLKQFTDVGLIPLFGLQKDTLQHRRSKKSCIEGLQHEQARGNQEDHRFGMETRQKILTPLPKHKQCQVCHEPFDDYQTHIDTIKHKRNVHDSMGMEYIRSTIEELNMAVFDQNDEEQLKNLMELNLTLQDTVPAIRDRFKMFLGNLRKARIE